MIKRETIIYAFAFVKTLTAKKIYNSLLLRFSYWWSVIIKNQYHWGYMENLSIEPTNLCNLKCPECPSGNNSMTRSRMFLSEENYRKTINQTFRHLVYLQLYFQGEPFMHPKITDYIKYAVNKNIFTSTSTNGHFLSPESCNKIVNSGLHQIIISIDGTTQKTYEKYRVGGSFVKVISGIKNLQKAKLENKKHHPHIVIQFVVFSTNEHQIQEIKRLAKELGISDLRLKSAQIENYKDGNALMPKNPKFNRYKKNKNENYTLQRKRNFKCFRVWNGSVISANGNLLPCCFDKNGSFKYTEQNNTNINQQWKNKSAKLFRKNVWQSENNYNICKNCTEGLRQTWFKQ